MNINRRGLLVGLAAAFAAPAIVHAGNLMPVKSYDLTHWRFFVAYAINTDSIMLRVDHTNFPLKNVRDHHGCLQQLTERQASRLFPDKPWRHHPNMRISSNLAFRTQEYWEGGVPALNIISPNPDWSVMDLHVSPSWGGAADGEFMKTLAQGGIIAPQRIPPVAMSSGRGSIVSPVV